MHHCRAAGIDRRVGARAFINVDGLCRARVMGPVQR